MKTHMKSAVIFDVPRTICGRKIFSTWQVVRNTWDIEVLNQVTCERCTKLIKEYLARVQP